MGKATSPLPPPPLAFDAGGKAAQYEKIHAERKDDPVMWGDCRNCGAPLESAKCKYCGSS